MEDFELVSIGAGARIGSKVSAVSVSRGVQEWGHVTIGARVHVCESSTLGMGAVVGDDAVIHAGTHVRAAGLHKLDLHLRHCDTALPMKRAPAGPSSPPNVMQRQSPSLALSV